MAKSKLSIDLAQALVSTTATLANMQQTLERDEHLKPEVTDKLVKQLQTAQHLSIALENHLSDIAKRETSPKLADRLRNLKNVFKNKDDLHAQRERAGKRYKVLSQQFDQLLSVAKSVMSKSDATNVREVAKDCLLKIRQTEIEVRNLDRQVEAIETALA